MEGLQGISIAKIINGRGYAISVCISNFYILRQILPGFPYDETVYIDPRYFMFQFRPVCNFICHLKLCSNTSAV